jgi:LacI family transcriptional regulator
MARRRVTMADLATAAGVSKPTVSRALNGHPDVGAETRERILRLAEEIGYVPSMSAQALRTGRFKMLGLLVPNIAWDWMPDVIRGVTEEADRRGYATLLQPMDASAKTEADFVERVLPVLPVDGLVLVIPPGLVERIAELHAGGLKVVAIDDRVERPQFPSVETTDRESVRRVTEHLIATGRRRIAFASSDDTRNLRLRRDGYRDALAAADLPETVLMTSDLDHRALAAEVARRADEFDAVVTAFDDLAFTVLAALRDAGRRVPEDVAVTGFDDVPAARLTHPALTTVRAPFYELGAAAVHMLIQAVEGEAIPDRVVLPRARRLTPPQRRLT